MRSLALILCFLFLSLQAESVWAQRDYGNKYGYNNSSDRQYNEDGTANPYYVPMDKRINQGKDCKALRYSPDNPNSFADDIALPGGRICPCVPEPGLWLERIVFCFASVPDGLMYAASQQILQKLGPYYWLMAGPVMLFAVVLFGWKVTLGTIRSVPKDTFTFGLKLGGVLTFLWMFPTIHGLVLDMIQDLAGLVSEIFADMGNICNLKAGSDTPTLWAQFDCVFSKLLGLSIENKDSKFMGSGLMMGMGGYMFAFALIPGAGSAIFLLFFGVMMTLLGAAMRAVNTYLMAVMSASFLFLLAPLFVPMLLFGASYQRFYSWLQMMIGYILQPMMLMMFLGIMMVAMEFAIFVGPNSLFGVFTNSSSTKAEFFADQMIRGTDDGKKVNVLRNFKNKDRVIGYYDTNPEVTPAKPGFSESQQYNNPENTGAFSGLPTADPSFRASSTVDVGFNTPYMDPDGLVSDNNQKDNAVRSDLTTPQWIKRVFLQFLSTLVLAATLFTMLGHVPKITHDLVARKTGANLAKANVLGLAQAQRLIALLRRAAQIYIAAKTGNMKALGSALKESYENMVSKR